ncbi:hypothetical protein, partial [Mycoplasma elephantis]|uniref:hypothetical protein n=1 Tax=Mycoplasma elephantis TaxID=114882 RepID=UPI0005665923
MTQWIIVGAISVIIIVQLTTIILWFSLFRNNIRFNALGQMQFVYDFKNNRFKRTGWRNFRRDRPYKGIFKTFANYEWFDLNDFLVHLPIGKAARLKNVFLCNNGNNETYLSTFYINNSLYKITIFPANKDDEIFFNISWNFNKNIAFMLENYNFNIKKNNPYISIIPLCFKNEFNTNLKLFKEEFIEKIKYKKDILFYEDNEFYYLILVSNSYKKSLKKIKKFNNKNIRLFKKNLNFTEEYIYGRTYNINDYKNDINVVLYKFKNDFFNEFFKEKSFSFNNVYNIESIARIIKIDIKQITDTNNNNFSDLINIELQNEFYKIKYLFKILVNIYQKTILNIISTSNDANNFIVVDDYMLSRDILSKCGKNNFIILKTSFSKYKYLFKNENVKGFVLQNNNKNNLLNSCILAKPEFV